MDIKNGTLKCVLFCALCFSVFFTSCEWVTIEPITPELPPPDVEISFSTDIQPIFTDKCVACHPSTAGLDLSEGNSWTSIQNGRINSTTPAESLIYTKPDPSGSHPVKYSTTEAALVLRWIEEGAKNN
ncbi:MAG: hypothetical protein DRI95_06395 [Bacteroidetes bacterium]|nr:MAG: hypothetical protein DRI95_06395 [Bacteroidota bacterium]RLD86682.1 MAG: hypothetical protein DRJ07_00180 [Bacteroidota bacterium]